MTTDQSTGGVASRRQVLGRVGLYKPISVFSIPHPRTTVHLLFIGGIEYVVK